MEYQRKTVDFYKLEIFIKGRWETILDTDNIYEYRKILNEVYLRPGIKHKGKKYRRNKKEED